MGFGGNVCMMCRVAAFCMVPTFSTCSMPITRRHDGMRLAGFYSFLQEAWKRPGKAVVWDNFREKTAHVPACLLQIGMPQATMAGAMGKESLPA